MNITSHSTLPPSSSISQSTSTSQLPSYTTFIPSRDSFFNEASITFIPPSFFHHQAISPTSHLPIYQKVTHSWQSSTSTSLTQFSDNRTINVLYLNARSLISKLDDLLLICSSLSPDIICIVETWLSPDISDSEVSLPHNLCFWYNRDRHGGSVAVYVKSSLSASVLPSPVNLELILLSIKFSTNITSHFQIFIVLPVDIRIWNL